MTTATRPYTPGSLTVHRDPAALSQVSRALRQTGKRVVLVPTMGALHAGHRELIRAARAQGPTVVIVSIFVNPLQFGANEDLDAYPRTFDADRAICEEAGVELLFAPTAADMYPAGPDTPTSSGRLPTSSGRSPMTSGRPRAHSMHATAHSTGSLGQGVPRV